MRWRDVDLHAQRVRVRNAWVRYEHSGLKKWRLRTVFGDEDDPVFAHPELGMRTALGEMAEGRSNLARVAQNGS